MDDLVLADRQDVDNGKAISFKRADKRSKRVFLVCIGAHEFFSLEMWRAAITELVATTFLVFTLTISIVSCLESAVAEPKLLVPVSIFVIAFLFLLATIPISGGHMNPIFTFIAALKGVITFSRALVYLLAQCLGSILASLLIRSVMDSSRAQKYLLGGCLVDGNGQEEGVGAGTALTLEFLCDFLVLFVGVTVGFDKRRSKELGLVMVCIILAAAMGLAVFLSITVTGRAGYAGVGLNPARCLGPALFLGVPLWHGHWVFWAGPFFACVIYYGFTLTLPREEVEEGRDALQLGRTSCWGANGSSNEMS